MEKIKKIKYYFYILIKEILLFLFCGSVYSLIEVLYKGTDRGTHWSMFVLAGVCGVLFIDGLNNTFSYDMDFLLQIFLCMVFITMGEYWFGIMFNSDYSIWDYRHVWGNFQGQICLPFTLVWGLISMVSIPLLDYIEWKIFKYKPDIPPYYKIFGKKVFQFKQEII